MTKSSNQNLQHQLTPDILVLIHKQEIHIERIEEDCDDNHNQGDKRNSITNLHSQCARTHFEE
jgi:hypothetical protein